MDNGAIFYIVGPLLAVSAIVVAFDGLRFEKFPGRFGPLVALWFIVLVRAAPTSFAVLHSKDEEVKKEQEHGLQQATEESEASEQQ